MPIFSSHDTRTRLLLAARESFLKEGYRASMDRIAARAGVVKQTLYNHFPSKSELFSEAATFAAASIRVILDSRDDDVRACLIRFATAFREKILGSEGIALFRLLTAETARFPLLARAFFDKGPAQTISRLADFLARAMAAGRLRQDDPRFAAQMLLGMISNTEHIQRLCAVLTDKTKESTRVAQIVDCFLRAYAPQRQARGTAAAKAFRGYEVKP